MAENDFEKTEPATPRRRREAREKGNVTKSQDLNAALALFFGMIMLYFFGMQMMGGMKLGVENTLSGAWIAHPTRMDGTEQFFAALIRIAVEAGLPIVLSLSSLALLANVLQVGFLLTGQPLIPNPGRLNPIKGFASLVDARAMMRLGMSLGKVGLVVGVAAISIYFDISKIAAISQLALMPMLGAISGIIFWMAMKIALVLLVLAVADYMFQRWKREEDLKMSKQEVKEEMKRMEGDPLIKQRRQRIARQLALQRVNQAVPGADVVVTNPTHYAVALKYDSDNMSAPRVVAKGADFIAARIRQLAAQHGIPIIERKELARGLYHSVDPGQEIPPEFYQAVAEILAYVYGLSKQSA